MAVVRKTFNDSLTAVIVFARKTLLTLPIVNLPLHIFEYYWVAGEYNNIIRLVTTKRDDRPGQIYTHLK